jgi:hypothetical protein
MENLRIRRVKDNSYPLHFKDAFEDKEKNIYFYLDLI